MDSGPCSLLAFIQLALLMEAELVLQEAQLDQTIKIGMLTTRGAPRGPCIHNNKQTTINAKTMKANNQLPAHNMRCLRLPRARQRAKAENLMLDNQSMNFPDRCHYIR